MQQPNVIESVPSIEQGEVAEHHVRVLRTEHSINSEESDRTEDNADLIRRRSSSEPAEFYSPDPNNDREVASETLCPSDMLHSDVLQSDMLHSDMREKYGQDEKEGHKGPQEIQENTSSSGLCQGDIISSSSDFDKTCDTNKADGHQLQQLSCSTYSCTTPTSSYSQSNMSDSIYTDSSSRQRRQGQSTFYPAVGSKQLSQHALLLPSAPEECLTNISSLDQQSARTDVDSISVASTLSSHSSSTASPAADNRNCMGSLSDEQEENSK